jgi:hypothetical protein
MTGGTDMTAATFTAQPSGGTHAVVVGGSIAGLLAARVLADHLERVTIVERDELPERPEFRPGVPQSRHFHGLLGRGQEVLESLFSGLTAAGASLLEWPADLLSLGPAGWGWRFPTGISVLTPSRHLLEWAIRRRVAALACVRFVSSREAVGLVGTADGRAVCGVRLRRRARGTEARGGVAGEEQLAADVVVDASGRGSHAPRWLEALALALGGGQETVVTIPFSGPEPKIASRSFEYLRSTEPVRGLIWSVSGGELRLDIPRQQANPGQEFIVVKIRATNPSPDPVFMRGRGASPQYGPDYLRIRADNGVLLQVSAELGPLPNEFPGKAEQDTLYAWQLPLGSTNPKLVILSPDGSEHELELGPLPPP